MPPPAIPGRLGHPIPEPRPCPTPKPSIPCSPPPARPQRWCSSPARSPSTRIPEEARHYARRHLLDTVGVMIAGAGGMIATQAENVIKAVRPPGRIPVPGRARRADLLDAAFLGGTAAHGIELDDGYRHGSAHCGCVVIPAALAVCDRAARVRPCADRGDGRGLRDQHRARARLRARSAPARLSSDQRGRPVRRRDGDREAARARRHASAPTRSASRRRARAGLFAFVNGGGDIKRLHAGHASREGMQAALLAEQGVEGPPQRDRGARRLHAGVRVRPHRQGAADRAAARGRVRHHRLLHQAVCLLPSHPARGRGDVRAVQRREHRVRRRPQGRGRDLQDRVRARARAVGRLSPARS